MNLDVFGKMAQSLAPEQTTVENASAPDQPAIVQEEHHISFSEYIAVHGSVASWLTVEARKQFEAGRRYVLMEVVFLCATTQAVIPEWAVDSLLDISKRLSEGRTKDLNEAFGEPTLSRTLRATRKKRLDKASDVIQVLGQLRTTEGLNFSRDSLEVATQKIRERGIDVSTEDVRRIYEKYGRNLKHLAPRSGQDFTHIFETMPLSEHRRYGRPMFEDSLTLKKETD